MKRLFTLSLLGSWLCTALPVLAGTTVNVNLKVSMSAQMAAEQQFKKLIDQWANPGLDIKFKPRPTYSLDDPTMERVYLDNLTAAPNAAWYKQFRAFHDKLIAQPFAEAVFRHAATYCRGGAVFMEATCLAGGKVVYRGSVHNLLSMSRAEDTQLFFFTHYTRAALPQDPPSLQYLAHGTVGDPIFVDIPATIAPNVTQIRLTDHPAAAWPVPLTPAELAARSRPPVPRPRASGAASSGGGSRAPGAPGRSPAPGNGPAPRAGAGTPPPTTPPNVPPDAVPPTLPAPTGVPKQ